MSTPQFDWVLSRLPKAAQPVPPIYQPEVAARGVLYAADHPRRREYWAGGGRCRGGRRAGPAVKTLPAGRAGYGTRWIVASRT